MPELTKHEQWIELSLSGDLSEADRREMERWLLEDDANVERLARAFALDTQMRTVVVTGRLQDAAALLYPSIARASDADRQEVDQEMMNEVVEQAIAERHRHQAIFDASTRALVRDSEARRSSSARRVSRRSTRSHRGWSFGTAAGTILSSAAILAILVALAIAFSEDRSGEHEREIAESPSVGLRIDQPVAALVGVKDAQWQGHAPPINSVLFSGPLHLQAGYAEIELADGARVAIEGPTSFELIDGNQLSLESGKLVAHVPKRAHGFVVQTLDTTVVDLGTEFAVGVSPQDGTHVQVYNGVVTVHPPSQSKPLRTLHAGDACMVSPNSVRDISFQADLFVRHLPAEDEGATDAYPKTYADAVRAHNPLMWWSFDELIEGQVMDQGSAKINSRAIQGLRLTESPLGQAASINGHAMPITVMHGKTMPLKQDFTIEAWIRIQSSSIKPSRLISNRFLPQRRGALANGFGFGLTGTQNASDPASDFVDLDGKRGRPNELSLKFTAYDIFDVFTERPIPLDEWVHIAVVYPDHAPLQMYINGEPERGLTIKTQNASQQNHGPYYHRWRNARPVRASDQPPSIGSNPTDTQTAEPFEGDVDELVIYGKPLSDQDIRELYRLGQASDQHRPTPPTPPVVE